MNSWKRFFYSLFEIPKGPFISDSGGLLFSRLELVLAPVKKMLYISYHLLMTLYWHCSGEYSSIALSCNSCSIALGRVWCCCWSSFQYLSRTCSNWLKRLRRHKNDCRQLIPTSKYFVSLQLPMCLGFGVISLISALFSLPLNDLPCSAVYIRLHYLAIYY